MIQNLQDLLADLSDRFRAQDIDERELEHRLLNVIAAEVDENALDRATWLKAFSQAEGDENKAKALYIKLRLERLLDRVAAQQIQQRNDLRVQQAAQKDAQRAAALQARKLHAQRTTQIDPQRSKREERESHNKLVGAIIITAVLILALGILVFKTSFIDTRSEYRGVGQDAYSSSADFSPPPPTASSVVPQPTPEVSAFQTSFNCQQQLNRVERMICSDQVIANKDLQVAELYTAARMESSSPTREQLRADQRRWLTQRNSCLSVICLTEIYDARISELRNLSSASEISATSATE